MFAACLVIEGQTPADRRNLEHFGVDAAIAVPAPWSARVDSDGIARGLEQHLAACSSPPGVEPVYHAAYGVHAAHGPTRSAERGWNVLTAAAQRGQLVAIGMLGLHGARSWERGATPRQLRIGADYRLPVLLLPAPGRRHIDTPRLLAAASEAGVPPAHCIVIGLDYTNARVVAHAGAAAVVLLGNGAQHDQGALALAADYGVELQRRMSFGLAPLPGAPDCTSFARALEWARAQHGAGALVERALVERPVWLPS